jgi:hypothetical protein
VCTPRESVVVLVVRLPPLSVPAATGVEPSRKVTAPTGVPAADVTPAVSETGWPWTTDPDGPDAVVVVLAAVTVWLTVFEVDELNPLVPRYTAVIGCEPTLSEEVMNVATPLPLTVPVPICDPLSRKLTMPVVGAGPDETVTAAVNVTGWPNSAVTMLELSVVVVSTGAGVMVTVNVAESLGAKLVVPA